MASFSERFATLVGRGAVGTAGFEVELVSERAAALGRAGRKVESTLAALNDAEAGADREALLKAASQAVWAFFVQREACGFRDQWGVIAHYGIPRAVLLRLGAR